MLLRGAGQYLTFFCLAACLLPCQRVVESCYTLITRIFLDIFFQSCGGRQFLPSSFAFKLDRSNDHMIENCVLVLKTDDNLENMCSRNVYKRVKYCQQNRLSLVIFRDVVGYIVMCKRLTTSLHPFIAVSSFVHIEGGQFCFRGMNAKVVLP